MTTKNGKDCKKSAVRSKTIKKTNSGLMVNKNLNKSLQCANSELFKYKEQLKLKEDRLHDVLYILGELMSTNVAQQMFISCMEGWVCSIEFPY